MLMHPFVVGELACGNLNNRVELLSLLRDLPPAPPATDAEALGFIDHHELMGRGITPFRKVGRWCIPCISRNIIVCFQSDFRSLSQGVD